MTDFVEGKDEVRAVRMWESDDAGDDEPGTGSSAGRFSVVSRYLILVTAMSRPRA
jgi:hypothetical protein